MGGYTTAKKEVIELLQRSRPYLFFKFFSAQLLELIKVFELLEKTPLKRQIRMEH
jgi:7-keto-8-aminopelargonate synthetase-like enzyme